MQTPQADSIRSVTWLGLGATTHSFNMSQINASEFTHGTGVLDVDRSFGPKSCPPGYYMLFILNDSAVPSIAKYGPDNTLRPVMKRMESPDEPP